MSEKTGKKDVYRENARIYKIYITDRTITPPVTSKYEANPHEHA